MVGIKQERRKYEFLDMSVMFLFRCIIMGTNYEEVVMLEKLKAIMGLKLSDKEKYELMKIIVHNEYLERESKA